MLSLTVDVGRTDGHLCVPATRFPGISSRAYACVADGHGMEPCLRDGDTLVIDPGRRPQPGDDVILWPCDQSRRPEVRRYCRSDGHTMTVATVTPPIATDVLIAELRAIHVVIGSLTPEEAAAARRLARRTARAIPAA